MGIPYDITLTFNCENNFDAGKIIEVFGAKYIVHRVEVSSSQPYIEGVIPAKKWIVSLSIFRG